MHVMFDSVDLSQIPATANAVAGYVGGAWPTDSHDALRAKFPHAFVVSIAVSATERASFLDVENGDATPGEATDWLENELHLGAERPGLYGSWSTMLELLRLLKAARIPRRKMRLWLATDDGLADAVAILTQRYHPSMGIHLPDGLSFGGVQYDWHALARNLDASLCRPGFFTPAEHPLYLAHPAAVAEPQHGGTEPAPGAPLTAAA